VRRGGSRKQRREQAGQTRAAVLAYLDKAFAAGLPKPSSDTLALILKMTRSTVDIQVRQLMLEGLYPKFPPPLKTASAKPPPTLDEIAERAAEIRRENIRDSAVNESENRPKTWHHGDSMDPDRLPAYRRERLMKVRRNPGKNGP
jgi:hypothetical protein